MKILPQWVTFWSHSLRVVIYFLVAATPTILAGVCCFLMAGVTGWRWIAGWCCCVSEWLCGFGAEGALVEELIFHLNKGIMRPCLCDLKLCVGMYKGGTTDV